MSQEQLILMLVRRFGLKDAITVTTPMATGIFLSAGQSPTSDEECTEMRNIPYHKLLGAVLYVMIAT